MPERGENTEAKKAYYEEKLWTKAEELSGQKIQLQIEIEKLYQKIQSGDLGGIGLYAQELKVKKEKEYGLLEEELAELKERENEVQKALEAVDRGEIDEAKLTEIVGQEGQQKISKRKQKILEERQRSGIDPRDGSVVALEGTGLGVGDYIVKNYGPDSRRITTGHHAKGIKGVIKSERGDYKDVEGQFYKATQDTHGGKAKYGKTGESYTSKSGKHVRKR